MHKHEGYNFCDRCHEQLYMPREYGPGPGGETMEERRLREQVNSLTVYENINKVFCRL